VINLSEGEEISKLNSKIDTLLNKVEHFQKLIESKDNQIANLNERNKELSTKVINTSNERIECEAKCTKLLEELSALKDEKFKVEKDFVLQKSEMESKIKKLVESKRKSADSQMGASMELDKVVIDLEEANKKLVEYESKILSLTRGKTGIILNKDDLIRIMKEWLISARRSIRIVVPTLADLEDNGLLELLNAQNESTSINIALDCANNQELINGWKSKGWTVADFNERDLWILNIDGGQILITVESKNEVSGIFSDIPQFIELFKTAMMQPFVKGRK